MARAETIRRNVALPVKNTVMVLSIVGAVNWGLVALFDFNLVEWLAGNRPITREGGRHTATTIRARVIYGLVGLSGLVLALVPPLKQVEPIRRTIAHPERSVLPRASTGDELSH